MQLRKHFMQRVKQTTKNLEKIALIERLRNRTIVPKKTPFQMKNIQTYILMIETQVKVYLEFQIIKKNTKNTENGKEVHNENQCNQSA